MMKRIITTGMIILISLSFVSCSSQTARETLMSADNHNRISAIEGSIYCYLKRDYPKKDTISLLESYIKEIDVSLEREKSAVLNVKSAKMISKDILEELKQEKPNKEILEEKMQDLNHLLSIN